ncbi:retrovirus-related pol polyprotein from transposon TNT 1-94, partial [Tanacetum coccineum]
MKAAFYPDVGLEQLVPDQFWIEEECKYDIAAMYGISHWWFQRQRFYIDRFSSEGDRRAVRTHMRILSVVRIEVFSLYGYNYMKKIILRRADLKEYVILERDFKYMYPSDFENLYLLNLQGHLNHLSPDDKKLNLTKPRWDATRFKFKHDYTVIDSARAVTFRDRYGVQMIMRVQSQQDKSRDEYKILDEERRCQKQGVHVRYPEMAKDTTYLLESGEPCWWTDSRRRLLVAPDWNEPFELMCDASDFALGAVLGQRHEKHFRPIHYASKTMNEAESRYTTTEKEMLAV